MIHQRNGRLTTEIDIGFVHQHHGSGILLKQLFNCCQWQQTTGGCIGVGKNNAAILTGVCAGIIGDINLKMFIQRNLFRLNAVQAAIHRIKAVGNIREQQRFAMLK